MTAETEPVRKNLYVAAAVSSAATFFGMCAVATPITVQVVFGALAAALGQFGVIAFATERARDKAWSPASVSELVDAEHVIAQVTAPPTVVLGGGGGGPYSGGGGAVSGLTGPHTINIEVTGATPPADEADPEP